MTEDSKTTTEKKTFLQKVLRFFPLLSVVGLIVGAIGGYIYYAQIGCVDGTCAITSNPWKSTLYGALLGYLLFDMFNRKPKAKKES